jgi:hypothetical protein
MRFLAGLSFRNSFFRNTLILFVWWIIFFPGFFSGDSFDAVEMARTGDLQNSGSASWALYVRIFSLHGHAIGLLTLINGITLVYAVTRIGYSLFSNRTAAIGTFLLTLTPVVSGMGITLWHDILMTAGILLIVSFYLNSLRINIHGKEGFFLDLLLGAILVTFRPNGLPALVFFSILFIGYLAAKKDFTKRIAVQVVASCGLSLSFTLLCSYVFIAQTPINSYFGTQWMRYDVSCYAATDEGAGFVEKFVPGVGSTESWASSEACSLLSNATLTYEEEIASTKYIYSAWLGLLRTDPGFIFETHLKRNAYLLPIPVFGIPEMPFLHSSIESLDQGIEWAFPTLAEKARNVMRIWNGARGFTGWAGIWLLYVVLRMLIFREKYLIVPSLMFAATVSILFVTAPLGDGRYALSILVIGQLLLIGNLIDHSKIRVFSPLKKNSM